MAEYGLRNNSPYLLKDEETQRRTLQEITKRRPHVARWLCASHQCQHYSSLIKFLNVYEKFRLSFIISYLLTYVHFGI